MTNLDKFDIFYFFTVFDTGQRLQFLRCFSMEPNSSCSGVPRTSIACAQIYLLVCVCCVVQCVHLRPKTGFWRLRTSLFIDPSSAPPSSQTTSDPKLSNRKLSRSSSLWKSALCEMVNLILRRWMDEVQFVTKCQPEILIAIFQTTSLQKF